MDLNTLLDSVSSLFSDGTDLASNAAQAADLQTLVDTQGVTDAAGNLISPGIYSGINGVSSAIDPSTDSSLNSALASMGGYQIDPSTGLITPSVGSQSAGFLNGDPISSYNSGVPDTSGGTSSNLLSSLLSGNSGGIPSSLLSSLGLGTGNPLSDASLLSALGSLGTGIANSSASSAAAQAQAQAAQQGMQLQQGNLASYLAPFNANGQAAAANLGAYTGAGTNALSALQSGLGLSSGTGVGALNQNFVPSISSAPSPNLYGLNPMLTPTVSASAPSGAPSVSSTVNPSAPSLPSVANTLGNIPLPTLQQYSLQGAQPTVTQNTSGSIPQWFNMIGNPSQLPGYQFTLDQGTQATLNYLSSQGMGVSGAAGKALANYAEGLAGTYVPTYANLAMNQTSQNLAAQNQAFGQQQQGYTNWLNTNTLGMNIANQNYAQQQSNFTDALNQATGLYGQEQQGFTNAVTAANLGLNYGTTNFSQQQQQYQNYLSQAGLGLNYGTTNYSQQQQDYSNALNQLNALYGQQFQNYGTSNALALQQGSQGLQQALQQYNMLSGLSGSGQTALNSLLSSGTSSLYPISSMGSSIASLLGSSAAANAAGTIGSTNAITGGVNNALGSLSQSSILPYLLAAYGSGGLNSLGVSS